MLIPSRYCGPPRSGNGGYTAGTLAHAYAGDPAGLTLTVTLRQPPPLDSSMTLTREGEVLTASFGGAVIATAERSDDELDAVAPVPFEDAVTASASYVGLQHHPFPTCFACGTERTDGLRVFPGRVLDGTPVGPGTRVAAPWTPAGDVRADFHELHDASPRACLASTWAALDCIGAWAADFGDRLMVLGRMTSTVDTLPALDEPHVVMGQHLATEGRRTMTAATLYDSDGRVVGTARHTWISVDAEAFAAVTGGA